jgi:hypothetical protein
MVIYFTISGFSPPYDEHGYHHAIPSGVNKRYQLCPKAALHWHNKPAAQATKPTSNKFRMGDLKTGWHHRNIQPKKERVSKRFCGNKISLEDSLRME